MTRLVEQLRLAEQAAEDIYFARIDRELIEALHQLAQVSPPDQEPFIQGHVHAEAEAGPIAGQATAHEHRK